jgi:phosphoribosylformimino-5-aminoimidazole carboxamide ribotide isomerase
MTVKPHTPRLIPVLDVMNGQVVRAVGGRRNEYRPLQSQLVQSTDPRTVAAALLDVTGAEELYLADLDAIQGRVKSGVEVLNLLEGATVPIWLDGGFGGGLEIPSLSDLPFVSPVIGFETCKTPEYLRDQLSCRVGRGFARPTRTSQAVEGGSHPMNRDSIHAIEPSQFHASDSLITRSVMTTLQHLAFSIDLRDGELIGDWRGWGLRDAGDSLGLARTVVQMGCGSLIVLDLARVGTGNGCGTDELLRAIRTEFPEIELIAGGGVKSWGDIDRLGKCGADAVLVASALHDGRLTLPQPVAPSPRP